VAYSLMPCDGSTFDGERVAGRQAGLSCLAVVWLMLSDIVGTSVLTLSGVAGDLGYVLTVLLILAMLPMSFQVSVLMSRTRRLLLLTARLESAQAAPALGSMGEVAGHTFRRGSCGTAVSTVVYGYTLLGNSSYLLMIAPDSELCLRDAVAAACLVLIVPLFAVRRLRDSAGLGLVNNFLIAGCIAVALWGIAGQPRRPCFNGPPAFAGGLSFLSSLGAATNIFYGFAGQWMYTVALPRASTAALGGKECRDAVARSNGHTPAAERVRVADFELMDTMAVPSEFPRAVALSCACVVVTYLTVALAGLFLDARGPSLLESMAPDGAQQAASALLYAHVVIGYVIKSVILARHLHGVLSPRDRDERTCASYLKHGGAGAAMLLFGFVVSNSVPFFSQLLGLVGGLLAGPINFVLPLALFLAARRRAVRLAAAVPPSPQGSEDGACLRDVRWCSEAQESDAGSTATTASASEDDVGCVRSLCRLRALDWLLMLATVGFTLTTMVFGVSDVIGQIIHLEGSDGAMFACHALKLHDVTDVR
ncbi:unnamed protein product, partial [Prorocentrum cordatum]